jgi:uncharacterized protein (DUF2252 family)
MTAPPQISAHPRYDPQPSQRAANGRARRQDVPRSSHGVWLPAPTRPDVIDTLEASNRGRLQSLVPIRYGRMLASPFAFLRGAATIMAGDLAGTLRTGIRTQICGDAHLANFGGFATPERNLIFDLNDFDETLRGPWEWDLKRLAASIVVCGRVNGLSDDACRDAVVATVCCYRERMRDYAEMRFLDIWYERIDADLALAHGEARLKPLEKAFEKGRRRTNVELLPKLAEQVDGSWLIVDEPPLLTHQVAAITRGLPELVASYKRSLPDDRRLVVERYRLVDLARKVVGVGSVGTRCYVALLLGSHDEDPLFLQIKEARRSVLEQALGRAHYANHGERVVTGQRIMQAASDLFLGWGRVGRGHYYVRQLRDMKCSVDLDDLDSGELTDYASLCAWAVAGGHARAGDAAAISGYLGKGDGFDEAIATFACAYADQTERDHATLVAAVKSGRIRARTDV